MQIKFWYFACTARPRPVGQLSTEHDVNNLLCGSGLYAEVDIEIDGSFSSY